jgi:hypothetical protein
LLLNNVMWQVKNLTQLTQQKATIPSQTPESPEAPVIQTEKETVYLHLHSYPNALHVINPFPGDTNDNADDTIIINIIQLDNYGSPLAPAIGDLTGISFINTKPTTNFMHDGSDKFHDDIKQTLADFNAAEEFYVVLDLPNMFMDQDIKLASDVVPDY